jgi:hypothetical protein
MEVLNPNSMKKEHIPGLIITIIVLMIGGFLFYNNIRKAKQLNEQLNLVYQIISIDEEINERIQNINHGDPSVFRNDKNHADITLANSKKKSLKTGRELNTQKPLDDLITVGDYLLKEAWSNRIKLMKLSNQDTLIYIFELRDGSGYPLKNRN